MTPPPEIQCKSLGMKVEVFDPVGNNIEHTGQPGELVCTRPHISLPLGFWGDSSGERFRDAYFDIYPGTNPSGHPTHLALTTSAQVFGGKATSSS